MRSSIIAVLLAAAALPATAQTATPRVDARPVAQVQAKEDKARAESPASARDRAKAAKAQKKKSRQLARQQKNDSQKKAPAS
jgi:hypothetical protein